MNKTHLEIGTAGLLNQFWAIYRHYEPEPLIVFGPGEEQQVMNLLWEKGFRPSHQEGHEEPREA